MLPLSTRRFFSKYVFILFGGGGGKKHLKNHKFYYCFTYVSANIVNKISLDVYTFYALKGLFFAKGWLFYILYFLPCMLLEIKERQIVKTLVVRLQRLFSPLKINFLLLIKHSDFFNMYHGEIIVGNVNFSIWFSKWILVYSFKQMDIQLDIFLLFSPLFFQSKHKL